MAYIEPCCVENQLPKLLRKEHGGFALFQTQGDVTIEKLMEAVGCMVDFGGGEYWIVVKEVDIQLMRFLRRWFDRKCISRLHLLTVADQTELVASELGDVWMKQTEYGWREDLRTELFCCVGKRESVVVVGEMLTVARTSSAMTSYAALLGMNEKLMGSEGVIGSLIENLRAVFKMLQRKVEGAVKKKSKRKDAATERQPAEIETEPEADALGTVAEAGSADMGKEGEVLPAGETSGHGQGDVSVEGETDA